MDLSQTVTGRLHFFDACFEGYPFAKFQVCEMSSFPVDHSIFLRHFEDQPNCSPQKTKTSWIEFRNPSKDWNGLSQLWMYSWVNILFPYFMWCFYIRVDLKMDGFENFLSFMAWFIFLQVRPSVDSCRFWWVVHWEVMVTSFWGNCGLDVLKNVWNCPLDFRDYDLNNKSSMIAWAFS